METTLNRPTVCDYWKTDFIYAFWLEHYLLLWFSISNYSILISYFCVDRCIYFYYFKIIPATITSTIHHSMPNYITAFVQKNYARFAHYRANRLYAFQRKQISLSNIPDTDWCYYVFSFHSQYNILHSTLWIVYK